MPRDARVGSLRLAWVVPGPLDQLTGGYIYDAQMVRALRAHGHDVQVVELDQRHWPLDPPAAARLGRAGRDPSLDAIIVDELAHPALALALPAITAASRAPTIIGLVHHPRCSEPAPAPLRALARAVERLALSRLDLAICTSPSTAAGLRHLLRSNVPVEVVEPGCDLHLAAVTNDVRRTTGDGSDGPPSFVVGRPSFRLLTVAHWTPRKGIVELLRALALSPATARLDLVGDVDRDRAYARRVRAELDRPELRGRVRVHGLLPSERLAALYRRADAFALASRHEGYGMVLAEAVVAGLPVVATRVGAVPDVVRDGQEAELVPAGDPVTLARAIARLAGDPAEHRRRAAEARERAASLPRWDTSCARFVRVVETWVRARVEIPCDLPEPAGDPRPA